MVAVPALVFPVTATACPVVVVTWQIVLKLKD
jgi:hypothetical protein